MAQPYVGEIRMFAGNFAPAGWMFCEGQLLPISENETLFQLIGTTYGGDGESTFALPDLRGRVPIHQGGGFILACTALFAGTAWAFGRRAPAADIAIGFVLALLIYAVFTRALTLSLPEGPLEALVQRGLDPVLRGILSLFR